MKSKKSKMTKQTFKVTIFCESSALTPKGVLEKFTYWYPNIQDSQLSIPLDNIHVELVEDEELKLKSPKIRKK